MKTRLTSAGRRFPTTCWNLVQAACAEEGDSRAALEELCRKYWRPIYSFARHRGLPPHDAEDVTQAFFAELLGDGQLRKAEQEKGRFRTFLIFRFRGFLSNHKQKQSAEVRGGTATHLSFDIEWAESRLKFADPRFADPDVYFDRQWALEIMRNARAALAARYGAQGKGDLFQVLKAGLARNPDASDYKRWEQELGMTSGALRVAMHRLRDRFRQEIETQILDTLADEGDLAEEIRHIRKALGHLADQE
jgi:RNA polymerase sigma-70 factor (ECF subfamily)